MTLEQDHTILIHQSQAGDPQALDRLIPLVYGDLRRMARNELHRHRGHNTLQPTALVNDVFVRLLERDAFAAVTDRRHFYNLCAQVMRQLLVGRARAADTHKRGGEWVRADLEHMPELALPEHTRLPELDLALDRLERLHPVLAEVVRLRSFGGLSVEEVAVLLEMDERTVYRHWAAAKAWLRKELPD